MLAVVAASAQAEAVVGLTTTNALVRFDSATPINASLPINITGLVGTNEQLIGIDRRPTTGALFGLGSSGRLYTLNADTGAATFVSLLTGATLSGSSFGIDFNPMVDRLRVTSNSGQNLRINVDTGAVTVDTALNGASTSLSASAYTPNVAGASGVTLLGIGASSDSLFFQNPPNAGTLVLVGSLGVDTTGVAGFDISGATGIAFASLTRADTGKSSFYTIGLNTGSATLIGAFGYGGNAAIAASLLDIAVTAVPEPGSYALFTAGLLALGSVLRRRRSRRQSQLHDCGHVR